MPRPSHSPSHQLNTQDSPETYNTDNDHEDPGHGDTRMYSDDESPPRSPSAVSATTGETAVQKRTRTSKACDVCRKKRTKCSAKKRGPVRRNTIRQLETRLKQMESLLSSNGNGNATAPSNCHAPPPPLYPCEQERQSVTPDAHSTSSTRNSAVSMDGPPPKRARSVNRHSPVREPVGAFLSTKQGKKIMLIADTGGNIILYHGSSHVGSTMVEMSARYESGLLRLPFIANPIISDGPSTALQRFLPVTHDQLLRLGTLYFQHIHPFLPIIDRNAFFRTVTEGPDSHPFRALLYAVLIVVIYHIPHPADLGVPAGLSMEDLMKNVRDILFEYEGPHVWIVQSMLLIALCTTGRGGGINKWRVMGYAVRGAQELGLHRDLMHIKRPVGRCDPTGTEETRSRTWVASYILERYASVSTGRPTMIRDDEWDAPWPSGQNEIDEERFDAEYLRYHAELTILLGQIADRAGRAKRNPRSHHAVPVSGENDIPNEEFVEIMTNRLSHWLDSLPSHLRVSQPISPVKAVTRNDVMFVGYNLAVISLRKTQFDFYDDLCLQSAVAIITIVEQFRAVREPTSVGLDFLNTNRSSGAGASTTACGIAGPSVGSILGSDYQNPGVCFLFPSLTHSAFVCCDVLITSYLKLTRPVNVLPPALRDYPAPTSLSPTDILWQLNSLHTSLIAIVPNHRVVQSVLAFMADIAEGHRIPDLKIYDWIRSKGWKRARDGLGCLNRGSYGSASAGDDHDRDGSMNVSPQQEAHSHVDDVRPSAQGHKNNPTGLPNEYQGLPSTVGTSSTGYSLGPLDYVAPHVQTMPGEGPAGGPDFMLDSMFAYGDDAAFLADLISFV
ncbi:hypothetical protein HDU85_004596 [Gaertneriomyces sp. JEL0708]|nr:hypothetical protein HDU85_004596 [Gaertneriomyces sp. JEL0708]